MSAFFLLEPHPAQKIPKRKKWEGNQAAFDIMLIIAAFIKTEIKGGYLNPLHRRPIDKKEKGREVKYEGGDEWANT